MSGYTPAGFNGDDKEDWATDPDAPKAPLRTREQVLGLTRSEILNLRGADLDAACALLCMDDARWNEDYDCWIVTAECWRFEPSTRIVSAALAYESMAARGWNKLTVEKNCLWFACMVDQSRDLGAVAPLMDTEAEARTMACVLASWKDGQDGIE